MSESLPERPTWADADTVRTVAYWIVALAGSWWLLSQLQYVLRPLLLAAFLAYVLLPYYTRLRKRLPAPLVITILASLTVIVLAGLTLSVYVSLVGLSEELPDIQQKIADAFAKGSRYLQGLMDRWSSPLLNSIMPAGVSLPTTLDTSTPSATPSNDESNWYSYAAQPFREILSSALNMAAGGLLEAAATGLYLLFLLLGAERFPDRVRRAYPDAQAEHILAVAGRINAAIVSYLKAKVKSSLLLAFVVGVLLGVFGVKFTILWVVLTFLCNFIPYIGSVIAFILPVTFAFLQLGFGAPALVLSGLLLGAHVASASLIEPMMIGRAVGISPLLLLAALSIWGMLWGLPGMFLAVPLTVVMKIVFENIQATRSMAQLLMDE